LQNFRLLKSSQFHVALARYFWAKSFLDELDTKPDMVLLADSRDVFFQGDPFEDDQEFIVCGEESIVIGKCPINSHWIEYTYEEKVLEELEKKPVLCSGVTLGRFDDVIAYTRIMVSEMEKKTHKLIGRNGLDQAIHNKILYVDKPIPYQKSRNGDELIATLGYSDLGEFLFGETRGLLTKEGRLVKIVHQYDRHETLAEWIRGAYIRHLVC